jgi:hypothetical protein
MTRDKLLYGFELIATETTGLRGYREKSTDELKELKRGKESALFGTNNAFNRGSLEFRDYRNQHTKLLEELTQIEIILEERQ